MRLRRVILRILGCLGIPFPSDCIWILFWLIRNSFRHLLMIQRVPLSRPAITVQSLSLNHLGIDHFNVFISVTPVTEWGVLHDLGRISLGIRTSPERSPCLARRLDPNPLSPSEWELAIELELPADPVFVHTASSVPRPQVVTFNSAFLGRQCFFFFLCCLLSSCEATKSGLGFGQSLGSRGQGGSPDQQGQSGTGGNPNMKSGGTKGDPGS